MEKLKNQHFSACRQIFLTFEGSNESLEPKEIVKISFVEISFLVS